MNLEALRVLATTAFGWAWKTSLAATLLFGLVLLVQGTIGRKLPARWRYSLWLLVVARLVLPLAPASGISVFNLVSASAEGGAGFDLVDNPANVVPASVPGATSTAASHAPASSHPKAAAELASTEIVRRGSVLPTACAFGWLLGVASVLVFVIAQHVRLAAHVRTLQPVASSPVTALLEQAKSMLGLKSGVEMVETPRLSTPAIFGFLRPRLLMPTGMPSSLTDDELLHIVLHELVHVRRRDVLLNWVFILVQALHWFNPAAWLTLRRTRAERELVCDAIVLFLLPTNKHHAYGGTLIKLATNSAGPAPAPSLAPVLNHPTEIERRIIMISKFKPTSPLTALAGATLLVTLACFTFTRAAEQARPAPVPADAPAATSDANRKKEAEQRERSLAVLQAELDHHQDLLAKESQRVDQLREALGITESDTSAPGANAALEPTLLHRLESLRIEAASDYARIESLYHQLEKHSRAELRQALPTACPDPQLTTLLGQLATAEQKLIEMKDQFSTNHTEVRTTQRVLDAIHQQVDERISGIMAGLNIKLSAEKARLDAMIRELESAKEKDIYESIKRRPYRQAKRDLENLQTVIDRLKTRIWQEKVDGAMPRQ